MIVICSGARDPTCKAFAIRPFVAADAQALSRYFHQLSSGDRYNRFFGATVPPSPSDLKKLALPGRVKSLVAIRGNANSPSRSQAPSAAQESALRF